jgi:beta-glucanase (GH16 family)
MMKKIDLFILTMGLFIPVHGGTQNATPVPQGYSRLVFQDEFTGENLPDSTKWGYETGYVRNGEMQYYANARIENSYQKDGILYINCLNDSVGIDGEMRPVSSASLTTKGKGDWKYGRIEVRAKLPEGSGTWPAIWMMPTDNVYGDWPKSGEIDILEHLGNEPSMFYHTIHTDKYNYSYGEGAKGAARQHPAATSEWHVFALEWREDCLEWYCDDRLQFQVVKTEDTWQTWPFSERFYLILNFAFAGGWGGQKGYDIRTLPLSFQIDYVRVFQ